MIDLYGNLTAIERVLDYHATRQTVLASNVANADTPGFVPRDVAFRLAMEQTRKPGANGVMSTQRVVRSSMDVVAAPDGPAGNDGNRVRIDMQMARMGTNALRYETLVETVARRLAMFRYAASDGQGG